MSCLKIEPLFTKVLVKSSLKILMMLLTMLNVVDYDYYRIMMEELLVMMMPNMVVRFSVNLIVDVDHYHSLNIVENVPYDV